MNGFIYGIIFIIGTFFGSFFTLAVYRIPKKEDILIKHSYCPNCNHKLGFFDLFPVLSYIFLKGKCRYCSNKIRARYLILELLSGLTFLFLAISIRLNVLETVSIINTAFLLLYVSVLFIIAGIDKENIKIEKNVLIFGSIVEALYIIYQYTLENFDVYQYVIYMILFVILILISKVNIKKYEKEPYSIQNLYLFLYMLIGCGIKLSIITLLPAFIIALIYKVILKRKNMPIGFMLCISNILVIAIFNTITNYIV